MHYKTHCFRLSEDILEAYRKMKPKNLSWNQFFKILLAMYEKSERAKKEKVK